MGFLDNSTNNIIIDAVLTDTGRRKLADNNGSFKVAGFSLGDEEVDYGVIEQYGRTVGKEKITKNTPILEAQTSGDLAMKYRLLTLPDATVIRLPVLSLSGDITTDTVSMTRTGANSSRTIRVSQQIDGQTKIPDGTADQTFTVFIPDRFLDIPGNVPLQIESTTKIATYNLNRGPVNPNTGGSTTTLSLSVDSGLDDTTFTVYGNGRTITTVVSIVGDSSGLRKDFTVTITK